MSIPAIDSHNPVDFQTLVAAIQRANEHFTSQVSRVINFLFVSKYQLQLPTPDVLRQQLEAERRRLEAEQESPQEKDLQ